MWQNWHKMNICTLNLTTMLHKHLSALHKKAAVNVLRNWTGSISAAAPSQMSYMRPAGGSSPQTSSHRSKTSNTEAQRQQQDAEWLGFIYSSLSLSAHIMKTAFYLSSVTQVYGFVMFFFFYEKSGWSVESWMENWMTYLRKTCCGYQNI